MATNQEKLDVIYDKIAAYPEVPGIAGKWPSRSIYRDNDNGIDDTVGMILNNDATGFDLKTEFEAVTLGLPDAVARVKRLAEGQGPAGSLDWAVARAKAVLAKVPKN